MNTSRCSCLIRVFIAAVAIALLLSSGNPTCAQNPALVIGSSNTVTADAPVPRPHESPCVVPLFSGFQFVDFNIQSFQFTPPANCPGPWEKIVFTADFNVTAGRQFDRTATVDLVYVNIYFGTTPEPRHNLSPSWHVERDETDYAALFSSGQTGHVILGNVVNSTYTGVISGSAQLEFYQAQGSAGSSPVGSPPDAVLPLTQANGSGGINEPAFLFTPSDQLATVFTLPTNIERAYLDVISQSQIGDEFWYSCVPNDVAAELQSCGNTAFREVEVTIDGQPAGVAPIYPWIYTGGVDPFLWEPIPGVQTLNFVPYRVDLTPFAGVLSNDQPHKVALSVYNADNYFSATATLLLYLDHGSKAVTGTVTTNTIGASPSPSVKENLHTDASGNISGSVTTASIRKFGVDGFVNTSHGRVDTQVRQTVNFRNLQNFTITATTYVQDISQNTEVVSNTIRRQGPGSFAVVETFRYPLTLNISLNFAPDGSFTQQTSASQGFKYSLVMPMFASFVDNLVTSADTLDISSAGTLAGNTGAESSQNYNSFDTRGQAYSCMLTSQDNVLTSVSRGCPSAE